MDYREFCARWDIALYPYQGLLMKRLLRISFVALLSTEITLERNCASQLLPLRTLRFNCQPYLFLSFAHDGKSHLFKAVLKQN